MSAAWTTRLGPRTRDRRRNLLATAPAYVESNAHDDHGRPGREDYTVLLLAPATPATPGALRPYRGRWRARRTGTTTAAAAAWTTRRTGTTAPAAPAWTSRRAATLTTAAAAWNTRRAAGTITTALATWTVHRTGEATS